MEDNKIKKSDLNKMLFNMQFLNLTNNFESMQAIGFLTSFAPILKRLYHNKPKEERVEAMNRHLKFFNSHVNSDALILGVTAAVEESTTEEEKDTVVAIKTGLMGPLAGIGDSVLKFTWLPICGSIGAALALNGSVIGPILMFLLYNVVNVATKYYGIHWGYQKGFEMVTGSGTNVLQRMANIANVVGLMVIGALIASVIKVKFVMELGAGENVIQLQEMFDKIMPGLFSLLVTIVVYRILKRTGGKHAAMLIMSIMVISILLYGLSIIG
ncbi:MAG: PTS system mannose/fructose/sorbose family transporter subunit IID [Lacrimispora sp.]|uniref:PTS system mannose/fructose/sorbose family transporter subunit IID n=1 Tax=Lacrimispora sp. TaxID=2719234 RepID=UPI0039E3092D